MKKILVICAAACLCMVACKNEKTVENPFLKPYDTPYGVPPFDVIKLEHFMPAFQVAMEKHNREIDAITKNRAVPDFENTILAFDKSGEDLDRVSLAFYCLVSNDINDKIQALAEELSPIMSKHYDEITLNSALFAKIKEVYDTRNDRGLDPYQIRTIEKYYEDFTRNGANLSPEDKEKLKEINSNLAAACLKFDNNLLAETNNFKMFLTNPEDLAGLPANVVDAAALAAKNEGKEGQWLFTVKKPSMLPFLQFSSNRDLREKLYRGYFMRCNNDNEYDNKALINEITDLRVEKAKVLGFQSFAEYNISKNMAKTPKAVFDFINSIWYPALEVAKQERDEMQTMIIKDSDKFQLASWDWWYYAERIRQQKYDFDESVLKPYFSLENVRNGMFLLSNKLYGINFKKLDNIPVYHPDVEVFEVTEADGSLVGLLYLDYFPRAGKGQGAWCSELRNGGADIDGNRIYPIMTITCNFTEPTETEPALLTFDETETLFHEFGHALQGLFSYSPYSRLCGNMPRDMVELPSQVMENWCSEPEMLKLYAKHYKTGEVIPDELIEKIQNSATFNTGFNTTELLAATLLDLNWNNRVRTGKVNVNSFEKNYLKNEGLIDEILPRYRSTYFSHSFTGDGYAAGYYVYTWAEVLDKDAFNAFKESNDIFNQELAAKFRKYILTECGNDEPMTQYRNFRGQDPDNTPYLKARGLYNVQ
ncbi:MAG: M3 family metallopeptidase [Bacteroidales bacterium]|nr:M3 family metallopeptidase [Bacteroidales bacterium]